jgi:hypothetical protein
MLDLNPGERVGVRRGELSNPNGMLSDDPKWLLESPPR